MWIQWGRVKKAPRGRSLILLYGHYPLHSEKFFSERIPAFDPIKLIISSNKTTMRICQKIDHLKWVYYVDRKFTPEHMFGKIIVE